MKDVHALPAPIVPHVWNKIDTSVDDEPVTQLADHLFAKHVETTRKLLTVAGLHVYSLQPGRPEVFVASDEGTDVALQVTMHADRGTTYELTVDGEIAEPSGARDTATTLLAVLARGTALEDSQQSHQLPESPESPASQESFEAPEPQEHQDDRQAPRVP